MKPSELMAKYKLTPALYEEMLRWVDEESLEPESDDPIERDINHDGKTERFEEEFRNKAPHLNYGEFCQVFAWLL